MAYQLQPTNIMNILKTSSARFSARPIVIGLSTVLVTSVIGFSIALSLGFVTPAPAAADGAVVAQGTFTTVGTANAHADADTQIATANQFASNAGAAPYNVTFSPNGPLFDQQCHNAGGSCDTTYDVLNTLEFTYTIPSGVNAHFEWDGGRTDSVGSDIGSTAKVIFQGGIPFLNSVPGSISGADASHTLALVADAAPAPTPVDGVCAVATSFDTINTCTIGTLGANSIQPDGSYQWYCNGLNNGATSPLCFYNPTAPSAPVVGKCDNTAVNHCAAGTLGSNALQPDGSYQWYCDGTPNTDANRSPLCFYNPPKQDGVCGTVDINSCAAGVLGANSIQPDGSYQWYCDGTHGGARSPLCYYVPLQCSLTANGDTGTTTVTSGSPVTLAWTTNRTVNANATFVIDQGVGSANVLGGSTVVHPTDSITYTGTLSDNYDFSPRREATCSVHVSVFTTVTPPPPPPPSTPAVPTCVLSASPSTFGATGGMTTLSWATVGEVTSAVINQGVGDVTAVAGNTKSVAVTASTNYTLTVSGPGGSSTCGTSVTVGSTPPPPPPPQPSAPTCTLSVDPASIKSGGQSTLSWKTTNAAKFSVASEYTSIVDGVVHDKVPVCSADKLTYDIDGNGKLDALTDGLLVTRYNSGLRGAALITGVIGTGATRTTATAVEAYLADINRDIDGDGVATQNDGTILMRILFGLRGTAVTDGLVGSGATNITDLQSANPSLLTAHYCASTGSITVSPVATTNYIGSVTSSTGAVAHCTATIVVTTTPPALSCDLTAEPTNVDSGGTSTLTWHTTGATKFSIDHDLGEVSSVTTGATTTKAITSATTFTGTATDAAGKTVTCQATVAVNTHGGGGGPTCSLSFSNSSIRIGATSVLSWDGSKVTEVAIDNDIGTKTDIPGSVTVKPAKTGSYTYTGTFKTTSGDPITCSAQLTVTRGGGGGGGSTPQTNVFVSSVPHVGQVLSSFLYLSQIPQTGLSLGPVGTTLYWLALIAWALALAYLILFGAAPVANRSIRNFGERVKNALNVQEVVAAGGAHMSQSVIVAHEHEEPEPVAHSVMPDAPQSHSSYHGFKSYAKDGALSIEDLVKSLSRAPAPQHTAPVHAEPVHEHVEPIYQNVEPIDEAPVASPEVDEVSVSTRGLTSALLEGDREAVFAGLRQHVRGGGSPEQLISPIVCLLDDAYRARVDGTPCDADVARLTARLTTPVLEKLVSALANAIDSSYTVDVTGAKLALTRALGVLGA